MHTRILVTRKERAGTATAPPVLGTHSGFNCINGSVLAWFRSLSVYQSRMIGARSTSLNSHSHIHTGLPLLCHSPNTDIDTDTLTIKYHAKHKIHGYTYVSLHDRNNPDLGTATRRGCPIPGTDSHRAHDAAFARSNAERSGR